jgi:hypothetical protein
MINQKMFGEIHALITEFPELHNQNTWESSPEENNTCGTTRCIAGWATWLGARDAGLLNRKREEATLSVRHTLATHLGIGTGTYDYEEYLGRYGRHEYAPLAATLLGLTGEQAAALFHDMNRDRVVARVKSYAETGADLSEEEWERFEPCFV